MSPETHELSLKQLRRRCNPKQFKFLSTKNLPPLENIIGQDRALGALEFGVDIKSHGYHIYALGPVGTGKSTIIRKLLTKQALRKKAPDDWLYVNNFEDQDKPRVLRLPAGKGKALKDDIDQMVDELKTEVPKAFESKEYEKEQEKIEQDFQRQIKDLFLELEKKVEEKKFVLVQTPHGMTAFPTADNKILSPEQQDALGKKEQAEIEKNQEAIRKEIRETLRHVEQLQKTGKNNVRALDQRVVGFAVDHLITDLQEEYADHAVVTEFLTKSREALLKNVQAFKQIKQSERLSKNQKMALGQLLSGSEEPSFDEYRVNLVVDNSATKGVPVIFEKNPVGPNLIGRVEQQGVLGALVTNFRMIKGGSLHKANGGYLIIEAYDLLQKPFAWHVLKRALKNYEIIIENMMESFGAFSTRTLEPEPIPLDIKVILVGDPFIYYLLYRLDQDFQELFKVKADFETRMDWNIETEKHYAQFISIICHEEKLKHFDPSAVALIIEHASRAVDNQKKLSTKFGDIVDLIRQASYWAGKGHHKHVEGVDIQKAIEEKIYRSSRIEEHLQEMIEEGTLFIDTEGEKVGQINGLAVLSLGDYSFGKPSRITACTFVGSEGIVNIDREVHLGGPIHNKGSMILAGYLGSKYVVDVPLVLSASVTFEQVYDEIDGDSASSTEIYALLSSLSGYPIRQDIAVTGSVNQLGEIQPIGGANEKIEGFFEVCKLKGLTGTQGVMIPHSNINHLMLKQEVLDAVKKGKFHIYAVSTIDEGIELLTGRKAGKRKTDGTYPQRTVNNTVQNRLIDLAKKLKGFSPKKNRKRKKKQG